MSDFLDELISQQETNMDSKVVDGMLGNVDGYIDTGSYILNGLCCLVVYTKVYRLTRLRPFLRVYWKDIFLTWVVKQFLTDNLGYSLF